MDSPVAAAANTTRTSPALAIAGVILSMALVAIGNGMMFAYIPVRLGAAGLPPTWAGAILTGLSVGGIAGCLLTGAVVRRTGHARTFMLFTALIVLSNVAVGAGVDPLLWIGARGLYGFAICGLFIVAQSWLNDAVDNTIRGRVMAIFYVGYIIGLGVGYRLLAYIDLDGAAAPMIGIAFAALSMLPVGMTRLPQPPPPSRASVAIRKAWAITPVGVAGMMASGGLSMMIGGFAPIHATAKGMSQVEVATLLSIMPIGTLLFQIPLGWASDRTDRRYVLIATALMVAVSGVLALVYDMSSLLVLTAIYIVWSGTSESVYSLASAHANDRASKDDMLMLTSTMLFAWAVAGAVAPAIGTVLIGLYGTQSFIWVATAVAIVFAGFVSWRTVRTRATSGEGGSFPPMTAQAPLPVELAFSGDAESERNTK